MRFYTKQHRFYCGIDLHARSMYVCILDQAGEVLVHKNLPADPAAFLEVVAPYREDVVVAVECIFTWYWLADLCYADSSSFSVLPSLVFQAVRPLAWPPCTTAAAALGLANS